MDSTFSHLVGLIRATKVPVSVLLGVTRERIEEETTQDAATLREFLAARASSKNSRIARDAGETLSVDAVSTILGIGTAAVHKAKDEGRILAYQEVGKRSYLFPLFQFEDRAVATWVVELINIVGDGFAVLHFLTVKRKSLHNRSFLNTILTANSETSRKKAVEATLTAARNIQA